MARKPRTDFPGAWHHVMHRGARRAPVFLVDEHCNLFLDLVEKMTHEFELEVHAYSLMPNHYHLLVRSRHGNLSDGMRRLNGTYTQKVNLLHNWDGPVFRGRFHSEPVINEARLPYILAYIHLNPLRANLVTRIDSECWTSHRTYLERRYSPPWVTKNYFLDLFGDAQKMQDYILALHRGKESWPDEIDLDHGFFSNQEKVAKRRVQGRFQGRFIEPGKVMKMVVAQTRVDLEEIKQATRGPRANPARRFAAWTLREHTLLTNKEIGRLLDMSLNQVSNVLSRFRKSQDPFLAWIEGFERNK
jgi:REP element-mobilizing transposase RayT